jgi:KipI family sensor histidine kinase inhibitor
MALSRAKQSSSQIKILDVGDTSLLVDFQGQGSALNSVHRLCEFLLANHPSWLLDVSPGIDSLLVCLDFPSLDYEEVRQAARADLQIAMRKILSAPKLQNKNERVYRVRVCYDPEIAPDLISSAQKCNLTVREFINRHKRSQTFVDILGFMPGFAYCSGLDPSLRLPRLETPRTAVPPGSIAIAELQTGLYPQSTPGGWNVIGRTPDVLFDAKREPPNLLSAGARVEFIEITLDEYKKIQADLAKQNLPIEKLSHEVGNTIEVLSPGLLTTIQDLPRYGYAHLALSAGGPIDLDGAALANALIGNPSNAVGLEITGIGPNLLFHVDTWVAWVGGQVEVKLDNKSVFGNRSIRVLRGQTLNFSSIRQGYRVFLAIAGGIEVQSVLGRGGSHLSSGIGNKPLQKGEFLRLSKSDYSDRVPLLKRMIDSGISTTKWSIAPPVALSQKTQLIRAIPSLHTSLLSPQEQELLWKTIWTVSSQSNRMGMRLNSDFKITSPIAGIASQGICFGTVQLPPSGLPILMLSEHQTTGGYPRVLEVVRSERSKLAQMKPGDKFQFIKTSLDEADTANTLFFTNQIKTLSNIQSALLGNL